MANPSSWAGFGEKKEKLLIRDEDAIISQGPYGPMMTISPYLKQKLCIPWESALILKTMGRSHTLSFMQTKLRQKWSMTGQWHLTDLEGGYFVTRFQFKEDTNIVLLGGPWIIANQYLLVQRWRPNFVPRDDLIKQMAVWVRLSLELMEPEMLWRIGSMLGSTCKVDPVTISQARGRFAQLCVEIDISKPIIGSLYIYGRIIRVEYENLGNICFKYGRYGHNKDVCSKGYVDKETMDTSEHRAEAAPNKDNPYGPWLFASFNKDGNRPVKGTRITMAT
ncbi:hypothetical protein ACOSP7_014914 [Xanthoceras sorbifolium]